MVMTHGRVARPIRTTDSRGAADADAAAIWAILAEIPDPEIPTISVVDLGVIRSVKIDAHQLSVEILPTFVGCPAVEMMRTAIADRLSGIRPVVDVVATFAEPWTSDRITPSGRERLAAGGFAPPERDTEARGAPVALIPLAPRARCPFCGGHRTRLDNAFGPTLCRSIVYCLDCRQPFEQFKTV
jgi:ring-1,2-phenylacetyl-CoA epoxidase subunit PaaD